MTGPPRVTKLVRPKNACNDRPTVHARTDPYLVPERTQSCARIFSPIRKVARSGFRPGSVAKNDPLCLACKCAPATQAVTERSVQH